jgi:hypothetical protein
MIMVGALVVLEGEEWAEVVLVLAKPVVLVDVEVDSGGREGANQLLTLVLHAKTWCIPQESGVRVGAVGVEAVKGGGLEARNVNGLEMQHFRMGRRPQRSGTSGPSRIPSKLGELVGTVAVGNESPINAARGIEACGDDNAGGNETVDATMLEEVMKHDRIWQDDSEFDNTNGVTGRTASKTQEWRQLAIAEPRLTMQTR